MGLTFSQPWLLAALVAVGIPILIHLLRRRQLTIRRFSSVRFFLEMDQNARRRKRVRRWLLLSLRVLAIAFVVLALAGPHAGAGAGAKSDERLVIVLDQSISMSMDHRWARVAPILRREIASLNANHARVTIIGAGPTPKLLVDARRPSEAIAESKGFRPGFGTSDLTDALRRALSILSRYPAATRRSLRLVTDGQSSQKAQLTGRAIPRNCDFRIQTVTDQSARNAAVTSLKRIGPRQFEATLRNLSADGAVEGELAWRVNGAVARRDKLSLGAGAIMRSRFTLRAAPGGSRQLISALLQTQDALQADNCRSCVEDLEGPLRVVVAKSPAAPGLVPTEFFWVTALQSTAVEMYGTNQAKRAVRVVPVERLAQAIAEAHPDVVIISPTGEEPGSLAGVLESFLRAGGALILFSGDLAQRSLLMRQPWVPARLEALQDTSSWKGDGLQLDLSHREQGPLSVFDADSVRTFRSPAFSRRWTARLKEASQVAVRFEDGQPLVAVRHFEKGRCVWVNTSMDAEWTDWPRKRSFVPWVDGLVHFAAAKLGRKPQPFPSCAAGVAVTLSLPAAKGDRPVTLREWQGGKRFNAQIRKGRLEVPPLPPGLYEVRDHDERTISYLSSYVPVSESDPNVLSAQELAASIPRSPLPLTGGNFALSTGEHSSWIRQGLFLLVLGLLVAEMCYGNRLFA